MNKDKNKEDKPKKVLQIIVNILLTLVILLLVAIMAFFIYKNQKEGNAEENILSYT